MKILVCGGRDYNNPEKIKEVLDGKRPTEIIHGNARGADTLAGDYARSNGIECRRFPADWETYGRRAGHVRNTKMLIEGRPDCVIAFPGGRGTANMIDQATKANIETIIIGI